MKALVTVEPGRLEFQERETPRVERPDEVLLRILAAGVCGSDLHIWHGKNPFATYPRVMGHEIVGEIVEAGPAAEGFAVGDRVIVSQLESCGECYACRIGRPNVCQQLQVTGVHTDGGFREYMTAPAAKLYRLPAGMKPTDAVMIEPLSIALQGCWRGGLTADDTLLILGAGALGSSLLKVAKNSGARIIVADVFEEKLEAALAGGADAVVNTQKEGWKETLAQLTDGYGPTLCIDAACFPGSMKLLVEVCGNAGRVVTMGFATDEEAITPMSITGREIELRGSRLQSNKFGEVIAMLESGELSAEGLVSHVLPFEKGPEALALAASGDASVRKVVLTLE